MIYCLLIGNVAGYWTQLSEFQKVWLTEFKMHFQKAELRIVMCIDHKAFSNTLFISVLTS